MLVEPVPPYNWYEDPVSPEWPLYRNQVPQLWDELASLARPHSFVFDAERGWRADALNFQPSSKAKTQDRYVVTQLEIHGRLWTLTGVFDGHLGDVTVDHVAHHLPIIIRDEMRTLLRDKPSHTPSPEVIATTFSRAIVAFDDAIARDVLDLFGGISGLDNFTDSQIRDIINDQHRGGANWKKTRLCMYGTTALVALVDPEHRNLWVANLGDCQAIMVSESKGWKMELLTTTHNGYNDAELERIRKLHPGEPECILDRRVLGALAPTRCLGDIPFKQPPSFTRRILYNLSPGFHDTSPWEEFLLRNRTPPYITAEPEVVHRSLDGAPRWLVLASDGFTDLCEEEGEGVVVESWAGELNTPCEEGKRNMALRLLRRALGGDDEALERALALDMDTAWMDDTAIIVQVL